MSRRYYLRHRNEIIGYFSEDGKTYTPFNFYNNKDMIKFFPPGLYKWKKVNDRLEVVSKRLPSEQDISLWLSDRVFPEDRQGAEKLLKNLGLDYYDPWEIAIKTKGVSLNDMYWFTSDPDEMFYEVHPSAHFENTISAAKRDTDFDDEVNWVDFDEDSDETSAISEDLSLEFQLAAYFGKGD